MGTSIRRTVLWLVLAALAIAAAAWMAMGASATIDAGAPPVTGDVTGELKIVKNLGGNWPDGAFIFTWDCTDGQSGSATFPDDFTGANFETDEEYPLGTVCTVEETDGVLSVDDYDVTTHIEGTAGFQAINPRDVPINNSTGQNVIQYMNELKEVEPELATVWVNKKFDGPDWEFGFAFICNSYGNADTFVLGGGESTHFDIPFLEQRVLVTEENGEHDGLVCGVAEEALSGAWTVNVSVAGASDYKTETAGEASAMFLVYPGDAITVTFENIPGYGAQPPTGIPPVLVTDVS